MDLIAYLNAGWAPFIRPAPATRAWMDATPDSYAYRCLPLNIANAHGWEVLSPCGFEAAWDGGTGQGAVTVRPDAGSEPRTAPISLFGQGVLTFHIDAILRTPPGWNLWIGGSPNRPKDAIMPLTGVVETDWSPFTFTMNWRFTRPGARVRFEAMEPICFFFPVQRHALEGFAPAFAGLADDPETQRRFAEWSASRDAFQERVQQERPAAPADHWQKHYYRGVDASGQALVDDHMAKLRLKPFDRAAAPQAPVAPADDLNDAASAPAGSAPTPDLEALKLTLARREWLMQTIERQRDLAPASAVIERRTNLPGDEFAETYYAPGRPVVLNDETRGWLALRRWTPQYLRNLLGGTMVEFQGDRLANPRHEIEKAAHRRQAPFDAFLERILKPGAADDAYLTAYNHAHNQRALAPLQADLGYLDKFLARSHAGMEAMLWIGAAGATTALHHNLNNIMIAQLVGRKRVRLVPAAETGALYNDPHLFAHIAALPEPSKDEKFYRRTGGVRVYDLVLEPGQVLFTPLAWWRQDTALDGLNITATYTNFRWPNDAYTTYPTA